MNAFLLIFLTCGIMLDGDGLPYGNLLSKFENRDDYYEDYYLRKIPKLKTTPDRVKEFFVNHLSWFPMYDIQEEPKREYQTPQNKRSYFVNLELEEEETTVSTTTVLFGNFSEVLKKNYGKLKKYSETHHIRANWTNIKMKSTDSIHRIRAFVKNKHMGEVFKNVTHPLRYRGPLKHRSDHSKLRDNRYKYLGPSVRIHPKSSHVENINISTTTSFPFYDTHFSIPRKIKVIIDLESPERSTKIERKVNDKYLAQVEGDGGNSSNVLGTAGEMASDLAGRMTSLWHCVLGSHRVPDTKDIKFYLYTRRNIIQPELLRVNYDLIKKKVRTSPQYVDVDCVDLAPENIADFERVSDENREIIKSNFLNIKAPTKILIHGYTGSYKDSRMAKIKDAYLSNGRYNVIQVDWEILAAPPCYIRVTHHSKFVGETIAKFLDGLYLVGLNMSLVHLVGFSLGAQVAGFAGNNATIAPVCRITGLDPALPLFLHTEPSGHLDKLDAKFVDVIHTCGGILAMLDPLGHVDFYPNGGTRQPGCEFSNLKCSHSRAPQYFAESVVSQKKFTGRLCLSWEEYVAGNCDKNTNTSFMGEPCSRKKIRRNKSEYYKKVGIFRKHPKAFWDRMPPPDYFNKVNTRSAHNQACDNGFENSRSDISISEKHFKSSLRSETVGIVKALLGPSLEDAVLRTLEFGRSLMQKSELDAEQIGRDKKLSKKLPKEITDCSNKELNLKFLTEDRNKGAWRGNKNKSDEKEKLLALAGKLDKEGLSQKPNLSVRKFSNVSKIRSLDSDLKQSSPSPEKIKKQLEALIQINKDEPPEHSWNLISAKTPKTQAEMTVMPSLCVYKNETEMNYSSSCDVQSQVSKTGNDCNETTSRMRSTAKKRHPNKICQAPEFLSNALGPTIDVSIIDNLKMMRDIFKYDSGKGEGVVKEQQMKQEIHLQNSEGEMTCRIEELQKKIEELEQKEQCLIKHIEEEERERECKRRAFEEEEHRLTEMKVCMETLSEGKKSREAGRSLMEFNYDAKFESLQTRIANEEEKLSRLKNQHEQYKRELLEAKCRKEALKKNKCLLDAWDIFASRVCHTRLPSFSRAYDLERKEFKNEDINLHCCFPTVNSQDSSKPCCQRSCSRIRSRSDHSQSDSGKEQGSHTNIKGKIKMGEIQFPIQRDIVCGLHQMLKTCACSNKTAMRVTAQLASSEDDVLKKCRGAHGSFNKHYRSSLGIESSAELLMREASGDKHASRSKSDTSLKNEKCSKIVKVMWAVTRINIFQNNYRTYEIMDATCTPPPCPPAKTEGIFVVKSSQKKCCPPPSPSKCSPCTAEFH